MNHEGQNYSTLKVMVYFFLKKKKNHHQKTPSISKHCSTSMLLFKKEKEL